MSVAAAIAGALCAADPEPTREEPRRLTTVGVNARTGQLVRVPLTRYSRPVPSRAVTARAVPEKVVEAKEIRAEAPGVHNVVPPRSFDELVEQVARRYGIRSSFVHAVIKAESNYNPHAVSPKGARGLMQLMPQTARELGVRNIFDPAQNVEGGVRYLRQLLDQYEQPALSLAAYNAGPGAVDRYRGVPPYRETQQFVRRVNSLYQRYNQIGKATAASPPPKKLEGPRIYRWTDAAGITHYTTETP
jgi:soluble lytic murein transglycosylase-like protein